MPGIKMRTQTPLRIITSMKTPQQTINIYTLIH